MAFHYLRGCSAAALCIFIAQPALADLTGQDVWNDWRDYLASTGYQVSGSEATSGNTLTVSDITMTLPIPDEPDASVSVIVPSLALTTNGDGSVSVEFPSPMPIRFEGTGPDGEDAKGAVILTHSGMTMTVTGDPADMTTTYSAAEIAMMLDKVTVNGKAPDEAPARISVTLTDTKGSSRMTVGELRGFDQSYSAASVAYDFAFKDPDGPDHGSLKGTLQGLTGAFTGSIPKAMDTSNVAAMLKAGFAVDGSIAFTGGNSSLDGEGDGETFSAQTSSQGGGFGMAMNAERLGYDISGKGTKITVTSGQLPFPVEVNLAETAFRLAMPVAASDTPQDVAFHLTLGQFTMSDFIWGLFDPGGNLPRDPATVVLDLTGKVKLLLDILDPSAAEAMAMSPVPPGEIHALSVNDLLVQAVGAKLTGKGAFTFDNTDMRTIPGMPRPEGAIDLALDGANALLDNLVKMGILSSQDAMPARMMMGMFAVPGDGPDSLKSKIEINAQGHILANGQRIK